MQILDILLLYISTFLFILLLHKGSHKVRISIYKFHVYTYSVLTLYSHIRIHSLIIIVIVALPICSV